MAKAGRPKKKISKEDFEKLCAMQCTLAEIAGFFDCSEDTIERWCLSEYDQRFSEVFEQKSCKGKISIRRNQFRAAETGNTTMLIWLGKQYLGQTEKQEIAVSKDDDTVVEMEKYFKQKRKSENG